MILHICMNIIAFENTVLENVDRDWCCPEDRNVYSFTGIQYCVVCTQYYPVILSITEYFTMFEIKAERSGLGGKVL